MSTTFTKLPNGNVEMQINDKKYSIPPDRAILSIDDDDDNIIRINVPDFSEFRILHSEVSTPEYATRNELYDALKQSFFFRIKPQTNAENSFLFGDVEGGNYTEIKENGIIRFNGEAMPWDDFSTPLTRSKQGVNDKPDYDYNELGLLFPQNDTAETIQFNMQMSHRKKTGTAINLHIHYRQTSSLKPVFEVQYRFYNNGEQIPSQWTTLKTSDTGGNQGVFTYTSGSIIQIGTFPPIPAPTDEKISANLEIKLYRNDNVVTGDVLAKYVDFHFASDSLGSDTPLTKY